MNTPSRIPNDGLPRYRRLAELLRTEIEGGAIPVGTQMPTEVEICARFGVSRHTTREALRLLTELGLIERRQGSGSVVISTAPPQAYVHTMRSIRELYDYAVETQIRFDKIGTELPPADLRADLGPDGAQPWLEVQGLRSEGGDLSSAEARPNAICAIRVYVNPAFAAIAPDLPGVSGPIHAHIEDRFGVIVDEVEQIIRTGPMPPEAADVLDLPRGGLSACVTRRYFDAKGRVIILSVNHHPVDRFVFSMRLKKDARGKFS